MVVANQTERRAVHVLRPEHLGHLFAGDQHHKRVHLLTIPLGRVAARPLLPANTGSNSSSSIGLCGGALGVELFGARPLGRLLGPALGLRLLTRDAGVQQTVLVQQSASVRLVLALDRVTRRRRRLGRRPLLDAHSLHFAGLHRKRLRALFDHEAVDHVRQHHFGLEVFKCVDNFFVFTFRRCAHARLAAHAHLAGLLFAALAAVLLLGLCRRLCCLLLCFWLIFFLLDHRLDYVQRNELLIKWCRLIDDKILLLLLLLLLLMVLLMILLMMLMMMLLGGGGGRRRIDGKLELGGRLLGYFGRLLFVLDELAFDALAGESIDGVETGPAAFFAVNAGRVG
ncbi:hypothetical protein BpHYR1_019364 [Brachionus plicatilis]|uniref:Uncharacterized protein n=1 Tax=Brachionus plicatilis TaxID=10195 RepID=A0A3M7PYJ5_BRAPC|nr:hypothetical protein BpHYR1_019364 [Brachionus plicatilis]